MPPVQPPFSEPIKTARDLSSGHRLCLLEGAGRGGWSRLFANPLALFRSKDRRGTLAWADGGSERADGDAFRVLDGLLRRRPELVAAGYWSYDLRYQLERLPRLAVDDLELPDCWVGLYERPSALRQSDAVEPVASDLPPQPNTAPVIPVTPEQLTPERLGILPSVSRSQYEAAVRRVLEYIGAGDCYQVNLSQRFTACLAQTPWELYERLGAASPAPYSAFLDCGDHQVLSSSPELLLSISGGRVETRPIKGTRRRSLDPEEDAAIAAELLRSPKDRAELLMIVDLERNDLGRVCEFGSVHVPALYSLESFANVHHLVATIRGRLRAEVSPLECLRAAFPGGSITGAPKIRAMEIIEELEPFRRGVYTGAIGWVDAHGNAEWNIAIRTLLVKEGIAYFNVGGGIVADSDPAAEYEETLTKAAGMVRALAAER
jgi:para-aminobenzoate synthetase component 1